MSRFLWVCFGGAVGTGARYLVSGWALRALGPAFPYGTLVVNVVGSFLLGVIMELGLTTTRLPPDLRIVLASGVMGGFTTYSSFNYETLQFWQQGAWRLGLLNMAATFVLCLGAGLLGVAVVRWLGGR
jgi:CrcB protein